MLYLGILTHKRECVQSLQLCEQFEVTVCCHQIVAEVEGGESQKGKETLQCRESVVREIEEDETFQYLEEGGENGGGRGG